MANFYPTSSNSPLAYDYSEKDENLYIEDDISWLPYDLAPGQKWENIRHIRSKEFH